MAIVQDECKSNEADGLARSSLLDAIVRDGARKMLAAALQVEVAAYIDVHADREPTG